MKSSNNVLAGNQWRIIILLSVMSSCSNNEIKKQADSIKIFEKPFVANVKPPVVTLLDTCPAPRIVFVPGKPGGGYSIKMDRGSSRTQLLPSLSRPAGFNVAMKSFNVEDGLALSSVKSSYCDNSGNLWFGTFGGISRYDGKSFTNYSTKQGLWDNQVFSIFQDNNGAMWFGTWNGVTKYDGKTFKGYTEEDGVTCCIHYCISQDKKGNIWFGTGSGVTKYDGQSFTKYLPENGLAGEEVYSMLVAKNGDVWFGTQGGISKYDGNKFRNFTMANGLVNNYVTSILEDNGGNIWLGTKGGISKYNGEEFRNFTVADGLIGNSVSALLEADDHHLWIGTSEGVSEYNGQSFRNYTVANGLVSNEIYSIVKDKSDNIWFTTAGDGICKYSGSAFTGYTKAQGLSSNVINSVIRDKKGMLWLGTQGEGAVQYDGKSFRSFTMEQGLANNSVFCIYQDKKENIWFATSRGVSCYDGTSFTTYSIAQGLADPTVWSITEDTDGNLWMGTFGAGVSVLSRDRKTFTTYSTEQGLVGGNIHEVIKDRRGNMWLVNDGGGASKFNGKFFESYAVKQGMVGGGWLGVLADRNNNIWFATSEGVSRYDGKSFMNFKEEHGLPDQDVIDIAEDEKGRVWLGTRLGLSALTFKPKNEESSKDNGKGYISADTSISNEDLEKKYIPVFETFNFKNGYPVKDITGTNSMYADSNNILWAGTGDKLIRFDYSKIHANPNRPEVVIQHIKINNENISWYDLDKNKTITDSNTTASNIIEETELFGNPLQDEQRLVLRSKFGDIQFDSVTRWYSLPVNLVLPYGHNNVSFDFAAIEPGRPAFVLYQYMLEGYDNNWNPVTAKTSAGFGNIHEGSYTFKLKAQSPDGVWSEPVMWSFKVLAPWYRSWWAYTFYTLVFLLMISGFIRWRVKSLKKEKQLLEDKVNKRTNELKNEKEKVEVALAELKSTQTQLIQSEKMASLGELTAGIAHEIQNPLNFVNNFSEINKELLVEMKEEIDKGNLAEVKAIANDVIENEEKISHHGKRADAIVKGMLQHSQGSTGVKEPIDINKLADEYLRLAYHGLRAKDKSFNVSLRTDFDENIGNINIIPQDIGRVILNLLNNAFYAVEEKRKQQPDGYEPTVSVSTRKINEKVELRVMDNGNGIAQKVVEKIFQPFFTTKPTGQGTGLGLSLSYDIIKAQGGEIKVETREGEGTGFIIQLALV